MNKKNEDTGLTRIRNVILPDEINNSGFINERTIKVILERDHSIEEVKELLDQDLRYNEKRLAIIREHRSLDPDEVENRKTKGFRRYQYNVVAFCMVSALIAVWLGNIDTAWVFGPFAAVSLVAIVFNARERADDGEQLAKLLLAFAELKKGSHNERKK